MSLISACEKYTQYCLDEKTLFFVCYLCNLMSVVPYGFYVLVIVTACSLTSCYWDPRLRSDPAFFVQYEDPPEPSLKTCHNKGKPTVAQFIVLDGEIESTMA